MFNFRKKVAEQIFFREQLMLFLPWSDENEDILKCDYETKFKENLEIIQNNRAKFIFNETNDKIMNNAMTTDDNNMKKSDSESEDEERTKNELYILNDRANEGDIFPPNKRPSADSPTKKPTEYFPVPHMISNEDYLNLITSLNEKQRKYFLHITHLIKTNAEGIYECVLGRAGVGKSGLVKAIHQCLLRLHVSTSGNKLDDIIVLLCAPTGKAAFGIHGITLHSAFVLPLNQSSNEMLALSDSICNSLHSKLNN